MSEFIAEFTTEQLETKVSAAVVPEGKFGVAEFGSGESHIATLGLYICKGVVLYNPAKQRGLLAHVAYTTDLDRALDTIIDAFDTDLAASQVSIVKTNQAEESGQIKVLNGNAWPSTNRLAQTLLDKGAKRVNVDMNRAKSDARGIVLSTEDGKIFEITSHQSQVEPDIFWHKSAWNEPWLTWVG